MGEGPLVPTPLLCRAVIFLFQRERSEAAQIEKLLAEVSSLKSQLSSAMHTLEDIQEKCKRAETQHKMVTLLPGGGGGGDVHVVMKDFLYAQDESRLKDQVKSLQEKLNVVCLYDAHSTPSCLVMVLTVHPHAW